MNPTAARRTWGWFARERRHGGPLKLWHRIAYGFASLLVLMAVLLVVAVLQFRTLAHHSDRMLKVDFQRMLRVQSVYQHAQGHGEIGRAHV